MADLLSSSAQNARSGDNRASDMSIKDEKLNEAQQRLRQERKKKGSLFEYTKEDTFEIQDHFDKLQVAELSGALLAMFGMVCGMIIYDLTYSKETSEEKDVVVNTTFALCTISTLLLLLSITWRTYLEFAWERSRGVYAMHHTLMSSGKYKTLCLELLLGLMHPVWFLRDEEFEHCNSTVEECHYYTYNMVLTFLILFRVYLPLRYSSIASEYRDSRAQRVCLMNGTEAGSWFAVKCMMKDHPLNVVLFVMFLSILGGGYMIRLFERPFSVESGYDFDVYENSVWLVILTMTTVGYGDISTLTMMGRIVAVVIGLWGVLVISLMVVTLTNMLELDLGEQSALHLHRRLAYKSELKNCAASVIGSVFVYKKLYEREPDNAKKLKEQLGEVRTNINEFQAVKMQQRSLYELDTPTDRIERKINRIGDFVDKTSGLVGSALAKAKRMQIHNAS